MTTRTWLTVTVLIPFKIGQFKNQIEFRQKVVSHLTVLYSSTGLKSGEYGDRNTTPTFGTSAGFFLKGAVVYYDYVFWLRLQFCKVCKDFQD